MNYEDYKNLENQYKLMTGITVGFAAGALYFGNQFINTGNLTALEGVVTLGVTSLGMITAGSKAWELQKDYKEAKHIVVNDDTMRIKSLDAQKVIKLEKDARLLTFITGLTFGFSIYKLQGDFKLVALASSLVTMGLAAAAVGKSKEAELLTHKLYDKLDDEEKIELNEFVKEKKK